MKQNGKKYNFNNSTVELERLKDMQGYDWMWAAEQKDGVTIAAECDYPEQGKKQKGVGLKLLTVKNFNAVVFSNNEAGSRTCFLHQNIATLGKSSTKPNLFIFDNSHELYEAHAETLKSEGYKVYLLNFKDEVASDKWNPLSALVWRVKLIRELENELENRDGKYYALDEVFTTYKQVRERATELRQSLYENVYEITESLFGGTTTENADISKKLISAFILAMCEDCIASKLCTSQLLLTNVYQNLLKYGVEGDDVLKGYLMKMRNRYSKAKVLMNEIFALQGGESFKKAVGGAIFLLSHAFDDKIGLITSEPLIDLYSEDEHQTAIFIVGDKTGCYQHRYIELFFTQAYKARMELEQMQSRRMDYEIPSFRRSSYFLINDYKSFLNVPFSKGIFTTDDMRRKLILVSQCYSQLLEKYGSGFEDWIKSSGVLKMFLSADDVESKKEYCELCCNREGTESKPEQKRVEMEIFDNAKGVGNAVVAVGDNPPASTRFTPAYKLFGLYCPEGEVKQVEKQRNTLDKSALFDIGRLEQTDDSLGEKKEVSPMK